MISDEHYYMRSPRLVVVTSSSRVLLVSEHGEVVVHATPHASRWSAFAQRLAAPASGAEVRDLVATMPELDERLFNRLVGEGFLVESPDTEALAQLRDSVFHDNRAFHLEAAKPVCNHLVIACTGSVVAGWIAPTILSLCFANFQRRFDVILTHAAQKFLTRDLLESYGIRTWTDAFERRDGVHVPHVELGQSADCIVVMPATASSLNRIATGACSDLLSTTVTASTATIVLAPAMNEAMWNNRAVQRNVRQLRDDGMYIIEPTVVFGAADLTRGGEPMYGGHGTSWTGPRSLMQALSAILRDPAHETATSTRNRHA